MKFVDLTGETYGRWTVLSFAHRSNSGQGLWNCRCSCGKENIVQATNLRSGTSKSCGCWKIEQSFTHGLTNHPAYRVYQAAKDRCERPENKSYKNYGGRGIKFLFTSFEEFWEELKESYVPGLTLDRVENNGDYRPGNVKWSTRVEQVNNRRNSVRYTYNGITQSQKTWADYFGCFDSRVRYYIMKLGVAKAFEKLQKEKDERLPSRSAGSEPVSVQ